MNKRLKRKKSNCRHDYKNAIKVGNVDHICPICKELLDPMEWFFINYLESLGAKFIETDELSEEVMRSAKPKLLPQKPLDVSPKAHHYDN